MPRLLNINLRVFDNFFFQAVKVKLVFNEIFIDFAEEAVVLEATEPLNPPYIHLFAKLGLFAHNNYYLNLIQIIHQKLNTLKSIC